MRLQTTKQPVYPHKFPFLFQVVKSIKKKKMSSPPQKKNNFGFAEAVNNKGNCIPQKRRGGKKGARDQIKGDGGVPRHKNRRQEAVECFQNNNKIKQQKSRKGEGMAPKDGRPLPFPQNQNGQKEVLRPPPPNLVNRGSRQGSAVWEVLSPKKKKKGSEEPGLPLMNA